MAAARRSGLGDYVHGTAPADELRGLVESCALEVEARGTFCPEPVIRTQKAVADLMPGEVAMLVADDAGIEVDLPAWCMSNRHEYLGMLNEGDFLRAFVRKRVSV